MTTTITTANLDAVFGVDSRQRLRVVGRGTKVHLGWDGATGNVGCNTRTYSARNVSRADVSVLCDKCFNSDLIDRLTA